MINRISLLMLTLFLTSCVSGDGKTAANFEVATPAIQKTVVIEDVVQKPDVVKNVIQKPDMEVVDVSTQLHIERLCMDYQLQGIPPYWDCLRKELSKLEGVSKPDMDVVDVSTQLLMERRCMDYQSEGVIPYWDCLRKELSSIGIE